MAHRTRIRANLAAWALNSAVLGTEYDALDAAQFAAIDGDAGGIWLPAAPIVVGGAGIQTVGTGAHGAYGARGFNASLQAQNWPERFTLGGQSGLTLNADIPFAFAQASPGTARYIAVPSNQTPYASEDGSTWVARGTTSGITSSAYSGIAGGVVGSTSGSFLVCFANDFAATSTDFGATFVGQANRCPQGVPCYAQSLGLWVIAGNAGGAGASTGIDTSPTGLTGTWTQRTVPAGWTAGSGGVKRIVWNGSLFVVLPKGSYNKVLTSPDGVTWTERAIGVTGTWTGLAYGSYDGLWLATGGTGSFAGVVYQSADGLTWGPRNNFTYGLNDIAVNQSLWVVPTAAGVNGGLIWSIDKGLTFQNANVGAHTLTTLTGYPRVVCADNRFVMLRNGPTTIESVLSLRSN